MERESKSIDLYCDYCGNKIYVRSIYKNDGSYQKDSIKLLNFDVCRSCSMEILEKLSTDIKEDKIQELFNNNKSKIPNLNIDYLNSILKNNSNTLV